MGPPPSSKKPSAASPLRWTQRVTFSHCKSRRQRDWGAVNVREQSEGGECYGKLDPVLNRSNGELGRTF